MQNTTPWHEMEEDVPAETADLTDSLMSLLCSKNLSSSNLCRFCAISCTSISAMRFEPLAWGCVGKLA
jgi:hypothetical protein